MGLRPGLPAEVGKVMTLRRRLRVFQPYTVEARTLYAIELEDRIEELEGEVIRLSVELAKKDTEIGQLEEACRLAMETILGPGEEGGDDGA